MRAPGKPLLALTADDLMSCDLVVIPEDMTLRCAAHLLSQAQVSGAPVVDSQGRCIGVLSGTDFVRWAEKLGRPASASECPTCLVPPCVCADWQMLEPDDLPTSEVRQHMTPDPVMTCPATPISQLARNMLDAHIHRIIVVDAQRRPIGIITSTDILAAVAYAGNLGQAASAAHKADPDRTAPLLPV
jgi:CBS domain-containing protein